MTNPHTFPRLRSSPDASAAAGTAARPADLRTFAAHDAGYRSLPHTPHPHHTPLSLAPRSIWVALRRDRQSRIHSILGAGAGAASAPQSAQAPKQRQEHQRRRAASLIESLSARELPKAIRLRARDVGWMIGQRAKPRPILLSGLADALRTTSLDEDDVIADALGAAVRSGYMPTAGEQSADFEAIQEIVALRRTARLLLRMKLEHPAPAVRANVADILARINGPKKTLKLPMAQPLAAGPSFFFPAHRFVLPAQLCLANDMDDDDGYESSSSDDSSDDGGETDAADFGPDRARRISAAAARRGLRSTGGPEAARAAHLMWARKYTECAVDQWPNGAPHLFRLFNPLPQCGFAMAGTLASVFGIRRSSLKEPDAHYLFAAAAAQAGCYPLVCLAEDRVMATCYEEDDGDAYEAWLLRGLAAAPAKIQLLAHIGHQLATRPQELAACDVRHYVEEYVAQHAEHSFQQHQHPQMLRLNQRQRGDSSNMAAVPRATVHRSLSTSVVNSVPHATPPTMNEFSRKALEQSAIRDLLHATVVMAIAHGMSSFAQASGITPDLDQPAGSFFPQTAGLMPITVAPGLPHVDPAVPAADQTEGAAADLAARLQAPTFSEDSGADLRCPRLSLSADVPSFRPAGTQPLSPLLRHVSGADLCADASRRTLSLVPDPLTSRVPQFVAYQQMRAQRLSRYEPHPYDGGCGDDQCLMMASVPGAAACEADQSASPSPLEIAPRIGRASTTAPPLPAPLDLLAAREQLLSVSQSQTAARRDQSQDRQRPGPVHLSQSEHLHWDVVSSYLQTQLGLDNDSLGAEVQAARSLVGRPLTTALPDPAVADDPSIVLADSIPRPVSSDPTAAEWEWSRSAMPALHDADMATKSYSLTNILALSHGCLSRCEGPMRTNSHTRDLDVRQLHDAVWHFTLSLFHIYEEFYFYSKFGDDDSPDSSRSDMQLNSALSMPVHSPETTTAETAMDASPSADMTDDGSGLLRSQSSQQYSKWITEELKDHIRAVAQNPASISAQAAQPIAATGLGLPVEAMLQINLVVSLARRQAEIIHAVRAVREYEATADC